MATLLETEYILDDRKITAWTQNQEKTISTEYPFSTQNEPLDQFVARTYLQFLWLPESIMPLKLLVPSLRRVNVPSTSSDAYVHPMHAFLEPILLTTATVHNKYNIELPHILSEGGGAGEMEETMMWYSLTHEKGIDGVPSFSEHNEGPWTNDDWRLKYMERMERREVQIQILLFLYKLSLPGPTPPEKKRKKRQRSKKDETPMTTQDHLEAFMDRLSMWQLLGTLEHEKNLAEEVDWIQAFVQELVEPMFKMQLPEFCSLLRSKVFPTSPFSDTEPEQAEESAQHTSSSPEPRSNRALSRVPSYSQIPSPTSSTTSQTVNNTKAKLSRARSRSLSVSLAQEQKDRERANSIPIKKPAFNREVSMTRVFKSKPKPSQTDAVTIKTVKTASTIPPKPANAHLGVTLVEETPAKPRVTSKPGANAQPVITLVEDSPVKPRVASTTAAFPPAFKRRSSLSFGSGAIKSLMDLSSVPESPVKGIDKGMDEEDGEEEWMMESSPPDIVFLNPKRGPNGVVQMDGSDDDEGVMATPSKPSRTSARLTSRKGR